MNNFMYLIGRGIEGCGVTKFSLEMAEWLNENVAKCNVIASKDKSWSRKYSHNIDSIMQYKFANDGEANMIIEECNKADIVFVASLPSKNHPEACINNFKRIIKETTTPIVMIQLDHNHLSIKRNAALDETIEACKFMFSLSRNNDFSQYAKNLLKPTSLAALFDDEETGVDKEIFAYQVGYKFEDNKKVYWKDITEQDPKHHKWIGRATSWKGYHQMFKFHNEYLAPSGYMTTMEGLEKSPAFLDIKARHDFEIVDHDQINNIQSYGGKAQIYHQFKNDEMLHRMSRCGFGYQLSILDQKYIEHAIEYTHCEIVAAGAIPVFSKEWGERATHKLKMCKLIDVPNSGTIWLDQYNMQPALDLINQLSNDDVMRDEWRHMAYENYKMHQDSDRVFKDMWTITQNMMEETC